MSELGVMLFLGKERQEDKKFKASLGYLRLCFQEKKNGVSLEEASVRK